MNAPAAVGPPPAVNGTGLRVDLAQIARLVAPGARVLDVGCGDGALLAHLVSEKQVDGRGIELSRQGVNACLAKGLFVVQGDADTELANFPTDSFDYVILSRTLQAVHRPRDVMAELARIGRRAIVSIPNFGHWRVRLQLLLAGRMPVTGTLDQSWYETLNIHLCTVRDFRSLVGELGLVVERFEAFNGDGRPLRLGPGLANIAADQAVFVVGRRG